MTSFQSIILFLITILSITCNSFLFQINLSKTTHFRGLLYEEKTRLGSTPPSCHNKCNLCHPCMPVQVPSMPGHNRQVAPMDYYDQPPTGGGNNNRYSNYKPLGWKCRCGSHLYNP